MRFESFIASRIIRSKPYKNTISAPIIKISILSITMGLVMMIVSISSGVGLQKTIQNKISSFFGHITISNFQNNLSQSSLKPISINQEFYNDNKNEEILHIQTVAYKSAVITTESTFEGVVFKGINKDFNSLEFANYLIDGELPSFEDKVNNEVIISEYLSKRLSIKIGERFRTSFFKAGSSIPNERNFKVVGIFKSGLIEFDQIYFLGDIRHIQLMNNWKLNQIGSFEIFIKNFDEVSNVSNNLYKNTPSDLDVISVKDKFTDIFNWIALFDMNILVIIIIMILVGGINMITALLVTVLEKTQLIGILKVLGSSQNSIRYIFLSNGFYLISLGLFFGNLIGLGLILFQKLTGFIKLNPETYYVSEVPLDLNLITIILLNIGVMFFCLLMLIVPSHIIGRISPTESLKIN